MSMITVIIATFGILIFGGGIIIMTYLMVERQRNAAKAENHTWVQIIPKAGMERNYRVPNELAGGVMSVRVPDANGQANEFSPIHIIGESGEYPAMWPPGKMKFVQVMMQKITYYEGDMEPLSNVMDMPIVSGQLIANLANGLTTAVAEVIRRSEEESGQARKSINKKQLLMFILIGGTLIAAIVAAIFAMKAAGIVPDIANLTKLVKEALGLQ